MIVDTIFVFVLCLQQPNQKHTGKFTELFEEADKQFNKEYKLDIEALKRAIHEAAISADEKTKAQREKVLDPLNLTRYFIYEINSKKNTENENEKK